MRSVGLALVATALVGSGCTPDRCRVGNNEISMVARAVDLSSDGVEEVHVAVDFATGDRAQLPIAWAKCDGDRILINGEEARESQQEGETVYTRTIAGSEAETISIELDRAEEDDVVTASVDRPPRFEMLTPEPGASLSRSEDILISWDPPLDDGDMQIELLEELGGGRCILSDDPEHDYKGVGGIRVPDDGTWTIPGGVLTNQGDLRCQARYVLRRFSLGAYPDALASGGFVQAEVLRVLLFESTP